jgi:RimJ/RimL family protein N-acetyltransferase
MLLLELCDDDFRVMLRGDAFVRAGLRQPPGGVDEPHVIEHVRAIAASLRREGYDGGQWMMVEGDEIVGLCGYKNAPSAKGEVEIGYGVAASRRRRGHAGAALEAMAEGARRDPAVRSLLAKTALDNHASQRALERNGFAPAGEHREADGEEVLLWRLFVDTLE